MGIRELFRKASSIPLPRIQLIAALAAALALSGCMNRLQSAKTGSQSLPQLLGNSSNYPIYVTQVVKSSTSPTTLFDILDDGSGSIGSKCGVSSTSGTAAPSPSPAQCVCAFTYSTSSGAKQTLEMPATYTEPDLLRCSYVGVPPDVPSVQVQIRILAGGVSNPTDFAFVNTNAPGDSANIANFARVRRFQCKKLLGPSREGVSYAWDSSFYDPVQAEDPHNADVLNFYTTNMGATLTYFARGSANSPAPSGWYCPPNPLDDSTGATVDSVNKLDMRLFSVNPYGGSYQIYPPVPGADRYTFYLATQPTGVFNVPVNAYVGPRLMTSNDSSGNGTGIPPIGYGAAPILVNVPGQSTPNETCPDTNSVPIPSGYQWVKIWLFRTTTPQKTIKVSQSFGQRVTGIGCDPGKWFNPPNPVPGNQPWVVDIIQGCHQAAPAPADVPYAATDLNVSVGIGTMLGRFLIDGTNPGACFKTSPGPAGAPGVNTGAQLGGGNGIPGADTWIANRVQSGGSYPQYSCSPASLGGDPLTTCGDMGGDTSVLFDRSLVTRAIPAGDVNGSNYDFIFVVTPSTVTLNQMNQWSTVSQYTPFRFSTPDDCPGNDPNACISTLQSQGNLSYLITNYGLKLHAVNQLDNPNGDDPTRPGAFPVCAIQPK